LLLDSKYDHIDSKFSYVVFRKTPYNSQEPRFPRLILPPLKRNKQVVLDYCNHDGKFQRTSVSKSQKTSDDQRIVYDHARKSHWGDIWPHLPVSKVITRPHQECLKGSELGKS
jgi:ribosomal protein RSM22 (predicted rRNA methylase)